MNLQFNNQHINHRYAYMSATRPPPTTATQGTCYIHLRSNPNRKYNFYNTAQHKYSRTYKKFQTGSTTTFSGYTNISSYNASNSYKNRKEEKNNIKSFNNINNTNKLSSDNNGKIPALMSIDCFKQPPRKNRRSLYHAQQYHDQVQTTYKSHRYPTMLPPTPLNEFNTLILSDSMCKYVRTDKISPPGMKVNVFVESGCDCSRMLEFLEKQKVKQCHIFKADFIVFLYVRMMLPVHD